MKARFAYPARIWAFLQTSPPRRDVIVLFALTASLAGSSFALLMMPFQVPDEAAHFYRAYDTSNATCTGPPAGSVPMALVSIQSTFPAGIQSAPAAVRARALEILRHPFETWRIGAPVAVMGNVGGDLYNCVPYIASGIAISAGRLVHLPVVPIFYLGRLANLIVFILLTSIALYLMPGFYLPLLGVALLPMTLHQAASYSADAVTISLSFLFFAYCMHLAFGRLETVRLRQYLFLLVLVALLSLCKFNVWFVILVLVIPGARFPSRSYRALACAGLLLVAAGAASWWSFHNRENIIRFEQFRKVVTHVDMAGNAQALVHGIPTFAAVLTRTLSVHREVYLDTLIGRLGPFSILLPRWLIWSNAALLILSAFIGDTVPRLRVYQRSILVMVATASFVSIFALMWIFETNAQMLSDFFNGGGVISGVHGRYFIPFAPILLASLSYACVRPTRLILLLAFAMMGTFNFVALVKVKETYFTSPVQVQTEIRSTIPEGALVRQPGPSAEDGRVFVISGGKRYWVTESQWIARYGYNWPADVRVVKGEDLSRIPYGGAISVASTADGAVLTLPPATAGSRYRGKVVRSPGSGRDDGKLFLIDRNQRRWIVRSGWAAAHGYTGSDVVLISPAELLAMPDATPIR